MGKKRIALGVVGGGAGCLGIGVLGVYLWAGWAAGARLNQTFETHTVDFPIPFPLSEEEIAEIAPEEGADAPDVEAIALERALARGKHLVEARYVCIECHGANFGGGTMVDDPMMGRILGPNLTTGAGSKTLGFTPTDWDRAVRHGVLADGTVSIMPSEDFRSMSDRELSDVVAWIRAQPPVDREVPEPTLGPLGKVVTATHQLPLTAEELPDHQTAHVTEPPPTAPTAEFGAHLIGVCTGCHGRDLTGGAIPGGDPNWVPASNLTPHEEGMAGWTFEQFEAVMRRGVRPDGSNVKVPMAMMLPYTMNMTDTEVKALWAYLQTVAPASDG